MVEEVKKDFPYSYEIYLPILVLWEKAQILTPFVNFVGARSGFFWEAGIIHKNEKQPVCF